MIVHKVIQGTPEWHEYRAQYFNASDAAAMLGESPYKTRAQLVKEAATGITQEVGAATQRRFDEGHRIEALARPWAEDILGEEFYPLVGSDGKYSASFDGITAEESTVWECKTLNQALREVMRGGCEGTDLPLHYQVQLEQQLLVSGADQVLFTAAGLGCDGLADERYFCWYHPNPALRQRIIDGWAQFEKDVAAYVPQAPSMEVEGMAPTTLPALRIDLTGEVTASNLPEFRDYALRQIGSINTTLTTDQDFADAEKTVKWCNEAEATLKAAKQHALSKTASIDELFRAIDEISEQLRQKRLTLEKLVKSEKEARRQQIVLDAQNRLNEHYAQLNSVLGGNWLVSPAGIFGPAIKGLKSIESMKNKVVSAYSIAVSEANATAARMRRNWAALADGGNWESLFPDFAQVGGKEAEDFDALMQFRILKHRESERARMEAEEKAKAAIEAQKAEAARLAANQIVPPPTDAEPVRIKSAAGVPASTEAATEIEYLRWFYQNINLGPKHESILENMNRKFTSETTKAVPVEYALVAR